MEINQTENVPSKIHDELPFVDSQQIAPGETEKYAYRITAPDDYVVAIEQGTAVSPRFVNVNGEKIDPATMITLQKHTVEGLPLADGIVFDESFDAFDYEEMRNEPAKQRKTTGAVVLDERESLYVLLSIPSGSADFDPSGSQLTIGEDTASIGKPVAIKPKSDISGQQQSLVNRTSNGRR